MRKKLIAGNWKMNGLKADAKALASAIFAKATSNMPFDMLVCPPMNVLGFVAELPHDNVFVGAQDVAETTKPNGAFTGDVSATMVKDLGATWTLVGHSERRQYHGETNAVVKQKASNAINAGLTTVICIGETLTEREAGQAVNVVRTQTRECVPAEATAENCVIAYEPVWAIGTGKVPTTADVAEIHAAVRDELAKVLPFSLRHFTFIFFALGTCISRPGKERQPSLLWTVPSCEDISGFIRTYLLYFSPSSSSGYITTAIDSPKPTCGAASPTPPIARQVCVISLMILGNFFSSRLKFILSVFLFKISSPYLYIFIIAIVKIYRKPPFPLPKVFLPLRLSGFVRCVMRPKPLQVFPFGHSRRKNLKPPLQFAVL